MMQAFDPLRFDAYEQLLASPQPDDLPRGGQVHRCDGDPDRRTTRLPGILMGWLQRRHLDVDAEEPLTRARTLRRAVRHGRPPNPSLRLLRPTGTG